MPVVEGSPLDGGFDSLMTYRASCPACRGWFPRRTAWRLKPRTVYRCQRCDAGIRPNQLWGWSGDAILIVLVLACLAAIVLVGLPPEIGIFGVFFVLAVAVAVFPYCTPFDLMDPARDGRQRERATVT